MRIPLPLQILAVGLFERLGLVPTIRNKYSYYTVLHALIDRAALGAPLSSEVRSSSLLRSTIVRRAKEGARPTGDAAEDRFSLAVQRAVMVVQKRYRQLLAERRAAKSAGDAEALHRLSPAARRAVARK